MAIVTMRRLTLLALQRDREALLERLLRLGCVEPVAADETALKPIARASELQNLRRDERLLEEALEQLKAVGATMTRTLPPICVEEDELLDRADLAARLHWAEQISEHTKKWDEAQRHRAQLLAEYEMWLPWKDCPLPLDMTQTEKTIIAYGTLPANTVKEKSFDTGVLFPIGSVGKVVCCAALCWKDDGEEWTRELHAAGWRNWDGGAPGTAEENLHRIERQREQAEETAEREKEAILAFSDKEKELKIARDQMQQKIALAQTQQKLTADETVFCLCGWIPQEKEKQLAVQLDGFCAAWNTRSPQEGEQPPTLLSNPQWMDPINVVTEMYSLPVYGGIDPNPYLFWFYIFFFGFMFADVAYGIILFATARLLLRLWHPMGTMARLLRLGCYLGISTALCGALTGGFFGNAIEVIAQNFFGRSVAELPIWLQQFQEGYLFHPLRSPMVVLYTALGIGVFQLVFGQCLHIYLAMRAGKLWDGLMDTVPWWIFFSGAAVWLLLGPSWLLWIGVAALIATQGRERHGFWKKLFGGLTGLYGLTNWLSDILSYSRLMAIMLATSVIATVVNTLGALPGSLIAFIPIFIIGHLFNIGVNLIGTYVHAARLQYLEFYGKFYLEGGVPFRPLSISTRYCAVIKEEKMYD